MGPDQNVEQYSMSAWQALLKLRSSMCAASAEPRPTGGPHKLNGRSEQRPWPLRRPFSLAGKPGKRPQERCPRDSAMGR